jgi:hypothetical protein
MWLKLRWARFFTLAGWKWKLSPRPGFDFQVTFPCEHGECNGSHTLIVRVSDQNHYTLAEKHQKTFACPYDEPHPALFGDGPANTYWEMCHGAGGGCETAERWTRYDARQLWERAAHD